MIVVLKRGTDVRVLRGIDMVDRRGQAVLIHHTRGDGMAFTEDYLATYDQAVIFGGLIPKRGSRLQPLEFLSTATRELLAAQEKSDGQSDG